MSPIKGGQRPWTQREGFVVKVPFSWALYLPPSAKDKRDPNFDAKKKMAEINEVDAGVDKE